MPRGKKNETEIERGVVSTDNAEETVEEQTATEQTSEEQAATEQTTSVPNGSEDSAEGASETQTVETSATDTIEDTNESAAEDKDSESASTDELTQVTEESEGAAVPAEKKEAAPKLTMLKGNFKVYRGRNLATITAMTATVVPSGDVIVENGVKWLPVIFTSKSGKVASGFIVVR